MAKNIKMQGDILQFGNDLESLKSEVEQLKKSIIEEINKENAFRIEANKLISDMDSFSSTLGTDTITIEELELFSQLDSEFEDYYQETHTTVRMFPELQPVEWIYASITGVIATAIDVIFVGTPDIVKLYKGGEQFDSSRLTALIRKIGSNSDGKVHAVTHYLSEKCKVPYDLSAVKGVMYPNNHRLRSLGHDPFLGLFFAVADIIMGTTTCVGNNGKLVVLPGKFEADNTEKLLSVFYYIGHIISDVCTARGIPIPGWCLTQFFVGNGDSKSVARIAEQMYLNGYDMRHFASMSIPVLVKNLLIDGYVNITSTEVEVNTHGIAEVVIHNQQITLKRQKMMYISDCVAVGGNLGKFLLPPSCGNPTSLNLVEWGSFIKHSIEMVKSATRDKTLETVVGQRKEINKRWEELLADL